MFSDNRLWAVTVRGNIYYLSVKSKCWEHVLNQNVALQGFKKVSASPSSVWGLGCDHQIYLYVPGSDLPIRCQEATYENERWIPSRGWSGANLLPVDPWHWSNESCSRHLPQEDFRLPSECWQWESVWYVDENVHGHLTDKGGWRYATIDFHHDFSHQKKLKSCVRRRRWIRYRRYAATDRWARIGSIHVDPLEEPVVDVAVGGHTMPNLPTGFLSVWIVTINGRVLFRSGVQRQCPEGQAWEEIPTGDFGEVLSISIGPTGLVWAVTWTGNILVRKGITWQVPTGKCWIEIDAPEAKDRLVQASVGTNAVWVTTTAGKVWFRKGVVAARTSEDEAALTGTGWVAMLHPMRCIAVGMNDQVWGLDYEERTLFLRTGVRGEEQTGKNWSHIDLPHAPPIYQTQRSRHPSALSQTKVEDFQTQSDNVSRKSDSPSEEVSIAYSMDSLTVCPDSSLSVFDDDSNTYLDDSLLEKATCDSIEDKHTSEQFNVEETSQEKDGYNKSVESKDSSVAVAAGSNPCSKKRSKKEVFLHKLGNEITKVTELTVVAELTKVAQSAINTANGKINPNNNPEDFKVSFSNSSGKAELDKIDIAPNSEAVSVRNSGGKRRTSSTSARNAFVIDDSPLLNQEKDNTNNQKAIPLSESTQSLGSVKSQGSGRSEGSTGVGRNHPPGEGEWDEEGDSETWWGEGSEYVDLVEDTEIQWVWVSAASCSISGENDIKHWLRQDKGGHHRNLSYVRQCSTSEWRKQILSLLQTRNSKISKDFMNYELAVEKSYWSKKGNLRWWQDLHRGYKWLDCGVELTQDVDPSMRTGSLTLQYEISGQHKHLQVSIADITCCCWLNDTAALPVLGVYTAPRLNCNPRQPPLKIAAHTEEELEDWLSALSVACCEQRQLIGMPRVGSIWATTNRGDIFVHEPHAELVSELAPYMFWHQLGGHLEKLESNMLGVTWGICYSGTPWVYTGGYGGAFFKGLASSPHGIHPQKDEKEVLIFENQRWRPVIGYTDKVLLSDRFNWSDESGKMECTKESAKLPTRHWHWISDWQVDHRTPGGVDKEGWQYARDFRGPFRSRPRLRSYVRRRRWVRKCEISTTGPWLEVGPLPLLDVSLQPDVDYVMNGTMAMWAIGGNGDVLCRVGVTKDKPQGDAWVHVPTDLPFTSISVGAKYKVWATAKDGSAWLRGGVSQLYITGVCWYHVPPPPSDALLKQISVGDSQVWAVDQNKVLWFREGIATNCPEGRSWTQVCSNIRHVSISPNDQVWTVVDEVPSKVGNLKGVVARRVGIPSDNPKIGSWDYGVGGGWHYVSARGWLK